MLVRLFDVQNGTVIPTEHCYTLKALKDIMDNYSDSYLTCPNPDMNPFFNTPEIDKESIILQEIDAKFSTEDDDVRIALLFCQRMYETPTSRAYKGIASMLDKLAKFMETSSLTTGRDGNMNSIIAAAKSFNDIRTSFKGVYKDLQEEQSSKVRGGIGLGYDQ